MYDTEAGWVPLVGTRMLLKAVCAWDDIHISVQTLIAIVITAWILSTHS